MVQYRHAELRAAFCLERIAILPVLRTNDGTHFFCCLSSILISPHVLWYAYPSTLTSLVPSLQGGYTLTVSGSNFGVSLPNITIAGAQCVVVFPFVPSAGHDTVRCTVAPGQGRDLLVLVGANTQFSSTVPTPGVNLFRYNPPSAISISPPTGPTSGDALGLPIPFSVGFYPGPSIVCVVRGSDFGLSGSVSFWPTSDTPGVDAEIVSWNHTTIQFLMPEGVGVGLLVVPFVGGQTPSDLTGSTPLLFSYDPPSLLGFGRSDRQPSQCLPIQSCYNGTQYCNEVPAQCYDTAGSYPLVLVGESFGRIPGGVTIGGRACTPIPGINQTDYTITCMVPQGYGDSNDIVVVAGGRASNALQFKYDPPIIQSIFPSTPDANGQVVKLQGKNFGFERMPVRVVIGTLECVPSTWINDGEVSCTTVPDVVGTKNVSVYAANRSLPVQLFAYQRAITPVCAYGFYGTNGLLCAQCPLGALCPGGETDTDLVKSIAGYWRVVPAQLTPEACPPQRQGAALPYCVNTIACQPSDSCLGNNVCSAGYTSDRCSLCADGFFRTNGHCAPCPSSPYAAIAIFIVGALTALGLSYLLNKSGISLTLISIGIDYAQVCFLV